MCGLLAYTGINSKRLHTEVLLESLGTLNHRGPDGSSHIVVDDVFLGHTRLSIIDLKLGDQPLTDVTNRFSVIFNGEIFNYKELRENLIKKNYSFETQSDTEVLLYHFIEFGKEGLIDLNGFFSFVIYDKLEKMIWFSRDRFGIKPLYIYKTDKQMILASEIKAISKSCKTSLDISDELMDEYIIYGFLSGGRTFHSRLSEVQPGLLYKYNITKNNLDMFEWFNVLKFNPEIAISAEQNYWDLISDAISLWSRSDVPISLLLSGGIDSSIIAHALTNENVLAYNLVPSLNSFSSEYDAALNVSNICGMNLVAVNEQECNIDSYLSFMSKFDMPVIDTNYWSLSNLCESINQDGIKVTFCGEGADELFAGYERHTKYADMLRLDDMNLSGVLQENYLSVNRLSVLKNGGKVHSHPQQRILWLEETRGLDPLERILRLDQKGFLGAYLKRQDEVGMLNSIEIRTPFLSNGIFALSRSTSSSLKTEIPNVGKLQKAFLKAVLSEKFGIKHDQKKKLRFNSFLKSSNLEIEKQLITYFSQKSLTIWEYIKQDRFKALIKESSKLITPGHDNTIFRILSLSEFIESSR
jgi:asparagine synthase (glutamine-hydrolysing)